MRVTPRRPRLLASITPPRTPEPNTREPDTPPKTAQPINDSPATSAQVVAEVAASLAGRTGTHFGLLTDSVLEIAQQRNAAAQRAIGSPSPLPPRPPHTAPPLDTTRSDVAQSDPYAAYSSFLRIAAPTAALGADGTTSAGDGAPTTASPYAAGVLARRMLRYFLARRNLDQFFEFFTGEFDNYDQVAAERHLGVLPGVGGGHEHIHCSLTRHGADAVHARYYFNGDPTVVFRARVYTVRVSERSDRGLIEMHISKDGKRLHGCEVYWERYEPVVDDQGAKALGIAEGTRFVGYMDGGGCNLYSTEINAHICVMDDLLLTRDQLWVADRAFDGEGNFVYGNQKGIPYKMKRVLQGDPLDWTFSPKFA